MAKKKTKICFKCGPCCKCCGSKSPHRSRKGPKNSDGNESDKGSKSPRRRKTCPDCPGSCHCCDEFRSATPARRRTRKQRSHAPQRSRSTYGRSGGSSTLFGSCPSLVKIGLIAAVVIVAVCWCRHWHGGGDSDGSSVTVGEQETVAEVVHATTHSKGVC